MQTERSKTPAPRQPAAPRRMRAAAQPLRGPVLPPPRRPTMDGRVAAAIVVFSGS
jgi:hypothetical protein